jgi:hypothetical protein
MTDIDPDADIELRAVDDVVSAGIPLAGDLTPDWLERYQRLARASGVPAHAEARVAGSVIVVSLPVRSSHGEIARTMDAARALIPVADAAGRDRQLEVTAEAGVADWWERRRARARRRPSRGVRVLRTGIGEENRWLLAIALALAIVVLLLLPARFSVGPNWVTPVIEAILLAAILVADLAGGSRRVAAVRALSVALILVLVADAAFVTARLIVDLAEGGPETNSAPDLLKVGFGVWFYTIVAFAFLYWLLDNGGAEARIWHAPDSPDLAFPQQLNPQVAPPGWRPMFPDYLYLGFTNATALSPTDVMPLAWWAKLAMAVQAIGSLAIIGLVIARAVNIFR